MPKPDLFLTLRFIIIGKLLLDANTGRGMSAEYSKIIYSSPPPSMQSPKPTSRRS